jgi:hypothetical protein
MVPVPVLLYEVLNIREPHTHTDAETHATMSISRYPLLTLTLTLKPTHHGHRKPFTHQPISPPSLSLSLSVVCGHVARGGGRLDIILHEVGTPSCGVPVHLRRVSCPRLRARSARVTLPTVLCFYDNVGRPFNTVHCNFGFRTYKVK